MSSIVDKINEVETERVERNHEINLALKKYWDNFFEAPKPDDGLFNDHSIIGFENRNVND